MSIKERFQKLLDKVGSGKTLFEDESAFVFDCMMSGIATPAQMGGILLALRARGETVDELIGGVRAMRNRAIKVMAPLGAVDTAGTGGDASGTFNISTASAIVVAASGIVVAKHGNRALTSKSGSADILAELGVNIDAEVSIVERCLTHVGIGFMMAPLYHKAMKNVAPTRLELGTRTIFNLLGPLSNPADAKFQLVGVYDSKWAEPMAEVLNKLGSKRVWIVHGSDGLDEITTTGPTEVVELNDGVIKRFSLSPEDVGFSRSELSDLKGGSSAENAQLMKGLLAGKKDPIRDIVLLNAGAMIFIGGGVESLRDGVNLAIESIDSGKAKDKLDALINVSNSSRKIISEKHSI